MGSITKNALQLITPETPKSILISSLPWVSWSSHHPSAALQHPLSHLSYLRGLGQRAWRNLRNLRPFVFAAIYSSSCMVSVPDQQLNSTFREHMSHACRCIRGRTSSTSCQSDLNQRSRCLNGASNDSRSMQRFVSNIVVLIEGREVGDKSTEETNNWKCCSMQPGYCVSMQ